MNQMSTRRNAHTQTDNHDRIQARSAELTKKKPPQFNYFYSIFALIPTQCNAHIHRKHVSPLISDSVFSLLVQRCTAKKHNLNVELRQIQPEL